jgi:hypothetical protein
MNADICVRVNDHSQRLVVPKFSSVECVTTTTRAFVLHNLESSLGSEIIN